MIQGTPQMRILVAGEAVDFRKGIDSLARLCQEHPHTDPFSGCLFVFRSRRATAIKVLVYDGQGFWLAQKRLSSGRFRWWPSAAAAATTLEAHQLQVLVAAGNPASAAAAPAWRRLRAVESFVRRHKLGSQGTWQFSNLRLYQEYGLHQLACSSAW